MKSRLSTLHTLHALKYASATVKTHEVLADPDIRWLSCLHPLLGVATISRKLTSVVQDGMAMKLVWCKLFKGIQSSLDLQQQTSSRSDHFSGLCLSDRVGCSEIQEPEKRCAHTR